MASAAKTSTTTSGRRPLPTHRPPRIALLSCNGAFEVEDRERRYDMWRSLRREIEAGNVDLITLALLLALDVGRAVGDVLL